MPSTEPRVLILACGALAREIRAIIDTHGWAHVHLHCLPAILHNSPADIPGAVAQAIEQRGQGFDRVFVAYADCGTGGALEAVCRAQGAEMIAGPHCYAFFDGLDQFAARDEPTSFYLTDFLARQFNAFVWEPLGLDRHPELLPLYFGNYEKLVYLAQTDDEALTAAAQDAAKRLGLAFERRKTGYGDLTPALTTAAKL